jgi:hypothetical protein
MGHQSKAQQRVALVCFALHAKMRLHVFEAMRLMLRSVLNCHGSTRIKSRA